MSRNDLGVELIKGRNKSRDGTDQGAEIINGRNKSRKGTELGGGTNQGAELVYEKK